MKLFIALFLSLNVLAIEGVYTLIVKKNEQKAQSRWTLGEWLATKQKIALMDQWLLLNTNQNLFEFVLDYKAFDFKQSSDSKRYNENILKTKLYITLLGFEYEKSQKKSDLEFSKMNASLRFFGTSQQSTHFNFLYGKKDIKHKTYGDFKPNFYGFDGDLYLLSFLGATGSFEKLRDSSNSNYSLSGEVNSYGGFVELWSLRVYYEF